MAIRKAVEAHRARWMAAVIYTKAKGGITGCQICATRWVTGTQPIHQLDCPTREEREKP